MDLVGEALLFGHEVQEPIKVHFLRRLQGRPVELPRRVIPLRVGVDSESWNLVDSVFLLFIVFAVLEALTRSRQSMSSI